MTNKEKTALLAIKLEGEIGTSPHSRQAIEEAILEMAEWKDKQYKEDKKETHTGKWHGYLVRSEGYECLEFYEKLPTRAFGEHTNHWTYSDRKSFETIVPLEIMPSLTWDDEPTEVDLEIKIITQ